MNEENGEWEEVESKVFKFEKKNDEIIGTYVGSEIGKNYGNKVFKLECEGENYAVFGTTVLESKMMSINVGDKIKIVLTGTKKNLKKGQNDIKEFKVFKYK